MSDNPADSLRRELETEIRHAIFDPNATTRRNVEEALYAWQARAVLAVVEPVLEAARADERERLIRAFMQALPEAPLDEHMGLMAAAEIVRAVSDGN